MKTTWRTHLIVVIFRWLWGQLRQEGTRQWVLNVSLEGLRDWLIQSPDEGVRVWFEVFEESDRLHRLWRCQQLLSALESLRHRHEVAPLVIYFRAKLSHRRGHLGKAEWGYQRVLLSRRLHRCLQAYALEGWAKLHYDQGRLLLAERLLLQSLQIFKQVGDMTGVASGYASLALLYRRRNLWAQSQAFSRRCLELLRGRQDPVSLHITGEVLLGVGVIERIQGEYKTTETIIRDLLRRFESLYDNFGYAIALYHAARMSLYQGKFVEGIQRAHQALTLFRSLQAQPEMGRALRTLGELYSATGDYHCAYRSLKESLHIFRRRHDAYSIGLVLGNMGVLLRRQGKIKQAERRLHQSVTLKRQVGDEVGVGWTLLELAYCYHAMGDLQRALSACEKGWMIARRYRHRPRERDALRLLAQLYQAQGQYAKARWCRNRARTLSDALRNTQV